MEGTSVEAPKAPRGRVRGGVGPGRGGVRGGGIPLPGGDGSGEGAVPFLRRRQWEFLRREQCPLPRKFW